MTGVTTLDPTAALDDPLGPGPGTLAPSLSPHTTVLERERTSTDDGDHERFAHFVKKDRIVESAVMGTPVTALCGKKWIPSRDPSRFPICPDCKRIYDGLTGSTPDGE
jgi:hypothetical protein